MLEDGILDALPAAPDTFEAYLGSYDEAGQRSDRGICFSPSVKIGNSTYICSRNLYIGEYQAGVMHGQGTWYNFHNGGSMDIYTGAWVNNAPNGYGENRTVYQDGNERIFSGNYTDGLEDGAMTYLSTGGDCQTPHGYSSSGGKWNIIEVWDNEYYSEPQALIVNCTCEGVGGGILTPVSAAETVYHGVHPWAAAAN